MGEEYGETAPFPFFVDHGDEGLLTATREGRRREFRDAWTEDVADPGDPATFRRAVLEPGRSAGEPHRTTLAAYTELLALRRRYDVLRGDAEQTVTLHGEAVVVDRRRGRTRSVVVLELSGTATAVRVDVAGLVMAFDSSAAMWHGDGATAVSDDGTLVVSGHSATLLVTP
jgi:maltooligosyltrehalose trehalohydrolase